MYVYIHIPFCNNICKYCDFPKLLYDKKLVNKYLDALEQEIMGKKDVLNQRETRNNLFIDGVKRSMVKRRQHK